MRGQSEYCSRHSIPVRSDTRSTPYQTFVPGSRRDQRSACHVGTPAGLASERSPARPTRRRGSSLRASRRVAYVKCQIFTLQCVHLLDSPSSPLSNCVRSWSGSHSFFGYDCVEIGNPAALVRKQNSIAFPGHAPGGHPRPSKASRGIDRIVYISVQRLLRQFGKGSLSGRHVLRRAGPQGVRPCRQWLPPPCTACSMP